MHGRERRDLFQTLGFKISKGNRSGRGNPLLLLDTARDPGNLHSGRWNSPVRFCTLLRGWERQRNGLKNLLRGRL